MVHIRCGDCAHEWMIERETPTFAPHTEPLKRDARNTD